MTNPITKSDILKKYKELPRKEKEIIGSSLVKVNMGVGLPADLKRIASFLKGSLYIAKPGFLDDIIQVLHDESPKISTSSLSMPEEPSIDPAVQGLTSYNEDEVTTTKASHREIK